MSAVVAFPHGKKNASAAERLDELAGLAREYPERFERFILCYVEPLKDGARKVRSLEYNCDMVQVVGLYELAKMTYIEQL